MTLSEIRNDLKQIRYYYYTNKEDLERCMKETGNVVFLKLVEKYNSAITTADIRLYNLYVSLYMDSHTQDSLAKKWGYTTEHVQRMHKKLLLFFQQYFTGKNAA